MLAREKRTCYICESPILPGDAIAWTPHKPIRHWHIACHRQFPDGLETFVRHVVKRELDARGLVDRRALDWELARRRHERERVLI